MKRIEKKFHQLKIKNECAFVCYICAGDPTYEISLKILENLPKARVDIIELGVPFLDPSGDGIVIQNAARRSINNKTTLKKTLLMAKEFRKIDNETPIILMGYYNPFLKYGLDKIFIDAEQSGIDGILIVDLPNEEKAEIATEIAKTKIDFINLIAPLTDENRIKTISESSIGGGFTYLVSSLGVTGDKMAKISDSKDIIKKIRRHSKLPIAIGFGIKNPSQANEFANSEVDGVIIGSEIVAEINKNYLENKNDDEIISATLKKINDFSNAIKTKSHV